MAKTTKAKTEEPTSTEGQSGLPPEAPTTEGTTTEGTTTEGTTTEGTTQEPPPDAEPVPALTPYQLAEAFTPTKWDDLPEDPEVRRLYVAMNGHLRAYAKH